MKSTTTIIRNVKGYTFYGNELISFASIAFRNGKILEVGDERAISDQFPNARVIDGRGQTMLPGLIDAHGHVMDLGKARMQVDLSETNTLDEVLDEVTKFASENPGITWIEGRGWDHSRWQNRRFPDAEVLDNAVADRPVWLTRIDGHAGWANTKAVERAGIDEETVTPDGGKIYRDQQDRPTGVFIDRAMKLIEDAIPEASAAYREKALQMALEKFRLLGITSTHDAGTDYETWNLYKNFAEKENLTVRIYAMIMGMDETFRKMSKKGPIFSIYDDRLSLRSIKLFSDGALGSRGAALLEPYEDDPGNDGFLFYNADRLSEKIEAGALQGYQINIHAIGDRANRTVLNAHGKVNQQKEENSALRHRIEHAQIVDPTDVKRFHDLGLIASIQPTHATSDMKMAEERLGKDRLEAAYPMKRFLNNGVRVAGGSDYPIESPNPFYGIHSAVTRKKLSGYPRDGWLAEETLNRAEALRLFTLDAAYAAHQEHCIGSLEPGKWADFVMVDRDIFSISASRIPGTIVNETWLEGEKIYPHM